MVRERLRFLEFYLLLTFLSIVWAIEIIQVYNHYFYSFQLPSYIFGILPLLPEPLPMPKHEMQQKYQLKCLYFLGSLQLVTMSSLSLHLVPEEAKSASECFSKAQESVGSAD